MAFKSCEVRWFFGGCIPSHIDEFARELQAKIEIREDRYLKVPTSTVSFKMRDRALEVKSRQGEERNEWLTNSAEGKIAWWEKRIFPLGAESSDSDGGDWFVIAKHRRIVTFAIEDGHTLKLVPGGSLL